MPFQTLFRAKAFGSGSQLWVLPQVEESDLVKKMDWYLNFQIAKSKKHKDPALSDEIEKMINNFKLRLPNYKPNRSHPLMISADKSFPCEMVVLVPYTQADTWVQSIDKLWKELNKPRLRVFLPKNLTVESFQKNWAELSPPIDEVTLVPS